jgi:type IV pilus assembly protein PilW
MNSPIKTRRLSHLQSGFSLIEVMVGLVLSLLVSLVIMQVFAVFEGQKRSSSGSADAQTNGSIAMYNLQRDLQLAGFALPLFSSSNAPLQCTAFIPSGTNISPVSITDGGTEAGASDILTVRYGTSDAGGSPAIISTVNSGNEVLVLNNASCKVNDSVIISKGTDCLFMQNGVTSLSDTTGITLNKPSAATINSDASLSCLGAWKAISYSINSGSQLSRSENGIASPNVDEIVNLQAQYGIANSPDSTGNNNTIVRWVNATGETWSNPNIANRKLIKAIRVAIVARNGLLEKETVSYPCSTAHPSLCAWTGTSESPAPTIDLSNLSNWQQYRYRVFTSIIPLRNVVWAKDALAS